MLDGLSRFTNNPVNLDIKRSMFNRSSQFKTTFNAGKLIPIYVDEVLPGDTFKMDLSAVVRAATPRVPVMDNAYVDVFWFFVPNRLVWDNWKQFMGENLDSYWIPETEKEIPVLRFYNSNPQGDVMLSPGDLLDYMGIPTNINLNGVTINALPVRGYCLIWNEWFRDQNTQAPVFVPKSDTTYDVTSADPFRGVTVLAVNKFHDYFTSCLPGPQKGPSVELPLGTFAPLKGTADFIVDTSTPSSDLLGLFDAGSNKYHFSSDFNPNEKELKGIVADLSGATAATINQLRQAFAIQRMYEAEARGGSRYTEIIRAHFGVTSPDARQQRPECLGAVRIPINMTQVAQTSSTDSTTPQGNVAAFSLTTDKSHAFVKSFTEHGYLFGLVCVRTDHTYQQGIERHWFRKRKFDYYFPKLANLGEQAVLNKEIFISNDLTTNEEVFGYQEAWAEYRYKPSRTSGYLRSTVSGSLDFWHYGDDFLFQPVLNADFMKETALNIDRSLAVSSNESHQFVADFYFDCKVSRPMPLYSIPGLIDHH